MGIDGVPQPRRYHKLGGKKIGKGKSCTVTLFGLLSAAWLLDLLLAGSRAIS